MSVSAPFLILSVHAIGTQTLLGHAPLWQSAATEHALVSAHFAAQEPPQSMSVSLPFFTPSAHEGTAHRLPVQTPLTQSTGARQPVPS